MIIRSTLLAGTTIAALIFAVPAVAQSNDTAFPSIDAAANNPDKTVAEDIVVNAARRPQFLQTIPAAITNFDREMIAKISPTNIGAVLNLVPGVSFVGENTYRTTLTIRGVSGTNEDAAVAMYLDGVFIGHDLGQNLSNLDPDSLQILRGPQGALYGKNTLGGAIIVNSRKPTFDTHLSALAGYGNDNSYNARASVTGTIVPDKIAGYIFGYTNGNDGRYYNIFSGKDVGTRRDFGGQAALLFRVSNNTDITIRGDYSRNRSQEANRKGVFTSGVFLPGQLSLGYNDEVALDFVGPSVTKNYGAQINVTVDAEPFTLTSITALRGYRVVDKRDIDGTGVANGESDIFQRESQVSQEFTLTSHGHHRFNWIAGIQLYHENLHEIFHNLDRVGNIIKAGLAARVPVNYYYDTGPYVTNSFAPYVQADYLLARGLTLAAGLRYSLDDRKYDKTETQILSNPTAIGFLYAYPEHASYHAFTPEASLTYEFTSSISLYGKYGKSYRPGGFSVNAVFNPAGANNFGKETADSFELGLRTRLLDNRLTFNVTGFRINWKNQQVGFINQSAAFTVANVQSRSQGIELETAASLTPAFQLGASATYLDARFGHAILPTRNPVTRVSFFADAYGTRLNFAPKWSLAGSATYTYQVDSEQSVILRADASYKTKVNIQPLRPDIAGPAIVRLNGRLEFDRGRYMAALWVKNALNRFSNYTVQSTATIDVIGLTEPRTFGAEIGFKF
jgi:iron complex outermembrane receptor protein